MKKLTVLLLGILVSVFTFNSNGLANLSDITADDVATVSSDGKKSYGKAVISKNKKIEITFDLENLSTDNIESAKLVLKLTKVKKAGSIEAYSGGTLITKENVGKDDSKLSIPVTDIVTKGSNTLTFELVGVDGLKAKLGDNPKLRLCQKSEGATGVSPLKVFDANGQELGLYVGRDNNNSTEVFIPSLQKPILISDYNNSGYATFGVSSFYESEDCTGTIYVNKAVGSSHLIFKIRYSDYVSYASSYYTVNVDTVAETLTVRSIYDGVICNTNNIGFEPIIGEFLLPTKVDLPFNVPVALPLKLVYE